jgi:hypothetical protein
MAREDQLLAVTVLEVADGGHPRRACTAPLLAESEIANIPACCADILVVPSGRSQTPYSWAVVDRYC